MSIPSSLRRVHALVFLWAFALAACHGDRDGASVSGAKIAEAASATSGGHGKSSAADDPINAQPARPDPCGFLPLEDAKRLLGPLAGQPWRARNLDDTTSKGDGSTCDYPLTPRANVAEHSVIALELKTDGAIGF